MPGSLKRGLATTKPKFPTMAANPKKRTKLSVPPPPATSSSDEDSLPSDDDENDEEEDDDDDDDDDDKAAMLRALEAHGQAMFGGVDLPVALGPAASANAKGKRRAAVRTADDEHSDDSGDEEASWEGEDDEDDDEENEDEGMDDDDDDEEEEEDAPDATSSGSRAPEVVVYAPSSTKFEQSSDKSAYKAFMVRQRSVCSSSDYTDRAMDVGCRVPSRPKFSPTRQRCRERREPRRMKRSGCHLHHPIFPIFRHHLMLVYPLQS